MACLSYLDSSAVGVAMTEPFRCPAAVPAAVPLPAQLVVVAFRLKLGTEAVVMIGQLPEELGASFPTGKEEITTFEIVSTLVFILCKMQKKKSSFCFCFALVICFAQMVPRLAGNIHL